MRKLLSLAALVLAFAIIAPQLVQARAQNGPRISGPKFQYKLKNVFPVDGRQGVACDGTYIYVSGSKALFKYDMNGKLVLKNENPFDGYPIPANHIGDIDYYQGELYLGVETFIDGVGKDIQVTVHDAQTLKLKRAFSFQPESGQLEVAGITVDPVKKTVWMCSWVGGESGNYLYEYDLKGQYLRKVHLQPVPQYVQGVYWVDGDLFVTADDGIADDNEPDHIYRVEVTSATNASVVLEKTLDEAIKQGEIEGLCIDPSTGDLLVLMNRGARIVLGMPKGFYPGYKNEISEVYRYAMAPRAMNRQAAPQKAPSMKSN